MDRDETREEINDCVWSISSRLNIVSRNIAGFPKWSVTTQTEALRMSIQNLQEAVVFAAKAMAHLEHIDRGDK